MCGLQINRQTVPESPSKLQKAGLCHSFGYRELQSVCGLNVGHRLAVYQTQQHIQGKI